MQTSSPYSIADDKMYDKFLHTIEYARQLIVVMDEIQGKMKAIKDEANKNGKITDEQSERYNRLNHELDELNNAYDEQAHQLTLLLNVNTLNEAFNKRYNARVDYYNDVIQKTQDYYIKLKDIQDEALSGQYRQKKIMRINVILKLQVIIKITILVQY